MSGHRPGLAVATRDLTLRYGDTTAVDSLNLELGANRIHGLLGRNGAGKTTLLTALASMRRASAGTIELDGADPFEREALTEQVALVRESGDVIPDERIKTTLDIYDAVRPSFDRSFAHDILAEFGVSVRSRPAALSRGQRSAVGIAIGLASRAPLTMFDEVHLGLDAPSRQRFYDLLLEEFAVSPRTVILSSHLISEVENLLETVTILHRGQLLLSVEAEELRAHGMTITGRADLVDAVVAGLRVIGVRDLGPTRQATVLGAPDEAWTADVERQGLAVGAVALQDLFIHLTDDPKPAPSAVASRQEIS